MNKKLEKVRTLMISTIAVQKRDKEVGIATKRRENGGHKRWKVGNSMAVVLVNREVGS